MSLSKFTVQISKSTATRIREEAEVSRTTVSEFCAELIEEGLLRRDYPLLDFRATSCGRVPYLADTRLSVFWVLQLIKSGTSCQQFCRQYEIAPQKLEMALRYAESHPLEVVAAETQEAENIQWIEQQEQLQGHR